MSFLNFSRFKPSIPGEFSEIIRIVFLVVGIQGAFFIFWIFSIRSVEAGYFLGISKTRLILVVFIAIVSAIFLGLGTKRGQKTKFASWLVTLLETNVQPSIFFFFWVTVLFFFAQLEAYFGILIAPFKSLDADVFFTRFRPVLIWSMLIFFEFGISVFLSKKSVLREIPENLKLFFSSLFFKIEDFFYSKTKTQRKNWLKDIWRRNILGISIWLSFVLLCVVIFLTEIGVTPDDRYWNAAGTPILPQQLTIIVLFVLFLMDVQRVLPKKYLVGFTKKQYLFYLIIACIWIASILIWNSQELMHTYFSPGPYPPNYKHYPFSDAARFDIGGQYFLLGEGLNNDNLTDRPFMMMFTAFLHLIGGQQYDNVVFVQIIFLALIPVFLFLIGWQLHSKTAGLFIALLGIIKEKNAINGANHVGIINAKVMMSELLNAFLLVILAYLVIRWLKEKQTNFIWPVLSGGIIGIAVGVRGNSIAVIPVILLISLTDLFIKKIKFKTWLVAAMVFCLSFSIVLLPYSVETYQKYGTPFWLSKIFFVFDRSTSEIFIPQDSAKLSKVVLRTNEGTNFDPQVQNNEGDFQLPDNFISLSLRHFVNNEIRTLFIYPVNFTVEEIDQFVEQTYWDPQSIWTREISIAEILMLGFLLLIFSQGIGYAYNKWKLIGIVPLLIHLGYNLSNSFARTSGGRYIVPTDWAAHIYFVLGFMAVVCQLRDCVINAENLKYEFSQSKKNLIIIIGSLLLFALIGGANNFSGLFDSQSKLNNTEAYINTFEGVIVKESIISKNVIDEYLQSESGLIETGLVFYPRYFKAGEQIERSSYIPSMPYDQPRIYFLLLTEEGPKHINILLGEQNMPSKVTNANLGIVLGCARGEYIDGLIFVPLEDFKKERIITSSSLAPCD